MSDTYRTQQERLERMLSNAVAAGLLRPATTDDRQATSHDLIAQQDLPNLDLVVPAWVGPNGEPIQWRLRGLSLVAQQAIQRAMRLTLYQRKQKNEAAPTDTTDDLTFNIQTLRHGIVAPPLSDAEAKLFEQRNPELVELLVTLIWQLTTSTQEAIDAYVEAKLTPPATA